jgi:aspartate-semialdehyde dehydrogenase
MDPGVPLVVPEINMGSVAEGCRLIANPNCSTIQLVMVLRPLMDLGAIEWASVSTYQSVSGAGSPALDQLECEQRGASDLDPGRRFHENVIAGIGPLGPDSYCEEEVKLMRETRRILGSTFPVYASCARVPVRTGHLESVVVRFGGPVSAGSAIERLSDADGVRVSPEGLAPAEVAGTDEVVAGRIRNFPGDPRILQLWITADNVRKGAALNAVQILEALAQRPVGNSHCSPPVKPPA